MTKYRLRKKSGGVCSLPRAMRLEWDYPYKWLGGYPLEFILVVPQSHFHFDVTDATSARGLIPPFDPSHARIRFPTTMPAFLNSVIDTMFEPVEGCATTRVQDVRRRTSRLSSRICV